MRLPTKLLIGTQWYTVIHDEYALKHKAVAAGVPHSVAGLTYPDESSIYVSSDLSSDRAKHVLMHEILHAIMDACSLDETLGEEKEEEVVARLTMVVQMFIRDNPEAIEYFKD